ncbi:peptidoglycan bridge formation glycyltransferase FemA/FemB family protein [Candidatus Peregrinibacteria bacterium]|nr:peptidoglycan bridge formation glycyltransferase FemA/FemB family protein [Candidatus Peregrinibacteria bacterium]
MNAHLLTLPDDARRYDSWVRSHPEGSLWQSLEWKTYQESLGREVRIYAAEAGGRIAASALVVIDRTRFGLSMWEIPRGPLGSGKLKVDGENLINEIIDDAKREHVVSLYASPPSNELSTFHFQLSTFHFPLSTFHFQLSTRLVHPQATRIIDLTLSEDDLFAQMKPKGRYNIRLAEKRGVAVIQSQDVHAYTALAKETWERDGFRGPKRGYEAFLKNLPGSFLLLATYEKKPLAGLLGVTWRTTGMYYYGASSHTHKELMAPYLLQWEAMKRCKTHGCSSYDLFGIAPESAVNHPWAGVSDFKAKFGGSVVTYPPEQEITLRPMAKTILTLKRRLLG